MGHFNDRSRMLARKRSAKQGREELGMMTALFLGPLALLARITIWLITLPFKIFFPKKR